MGVRGRQPVCALYVGRFQPFHKGHLHAVKYILSKASQLLVVVGSAQYSHTRKNPFSAGERITMIYRALDSEGVERARYSVFPVPDIHTHGLWVHHLVSYLPQFDVVYTNESLVKKLFEEDGHYRVEPIPLLERETFSATEIRQRMITDRDWSELVPATVADYIREIKGDTRVRDLAQTDKPRQRA